MRSTKGLRCKRCSGEACVRNGMNKGVQSYKCKGCGYRFIQGDKRKKPQTLFKKALAVMLYSSARASFNFLGKLFGVNRSTVYRWIKAEAQKIREEEIGEEVKEIEIDEMWHYLNKKKTKGGSSKPMIVIEKELWHGLSVIVALQLSKSAMKN